MLKFWVSHSEFQLEKNFGVKNDQGNSYQVLSLGQIDYKSPVGKSWN